MVSEGSSSRRDSAVPGRGLLTQLPVVYAVAIALHDAGVPMAAIAEQLGVPDESMPALLEIASAKLEGLRERDRRPNTAPWEETARP